MLANELFGTKLTQLVYWVCCFCLVLGGSVLGVMGCEMHELSVIGDIGAILLLWSRKFTEAVE
jgi:hypothetical protein